jgi:dTDP-4-dehydrorhamnose reductase
VKDPLRIIITGASGYLGHPLCKRLSGERIVPLYNNSKMEGGQRFDALTMRLEDVIVSGDRISHGLIYHADSSPNACSEDFEKSNALNIDSCISIVDSFLKLGIKPVFASSEAVFGQDKADPYVEADRPEPIFAYGRQKLAVEDYIQANCEDYLIVRIARVIGSDEKDPTGFEYWLNEMERNGVIRCASDQIMSPVCRDDATEGVARLIELDKSGIYHLPGARPIKRIDLLQLLLDEARGVRDVDVEVEQCSLHDFPVIERRPLNSTMGASKIIGETGIQLTTYEEICRRIATGILSPKIANLRNKG